MNRLCTHIALIARYICCAAIFIVACNTSHRCHAQSLPTEFDRTRDRAEDRINDRPRTGSLKNWLVVEVIERDTPRGKAVRFTDFLPVVIVDSATQAAIYARSGELVEVGVERTYYLSVASTGERRFTIDGDPVQRLRAGTPIEDDMVYQREFSIVYEGGPTPSLSVLPPQMNPQISPSQAASMPTQEETELARLKREMMAIRSELDDVKRDRLTRSTLPPQSATRGEERSSELQPIPQDIVAETLPTLAPTPQSSVYPPPASSQAASRMTLPEPRPLLPSDDEEAEGLSLPRVERQPYGPISLEQMPALDCGYRVQFCATPIEREAERIRAALEQGGVQETSVELFQEPRRRITFYRVRGGCFASYNQVRTALLSYARTAERLRLGLQPIIVRN
jgi:hypothetical protein